MTKWAFGIIGVVLILAGLVFFMYEEQDYDFDKTTKTYEIVKKWDLPNPLDEISGMVWLGDNKLACIQDEDGIIFIYDLSSSKIVNQLNFGGPGDYEAMSSLNDEFWVAESNGKLLRVNKRGGEEEPEEIKLQFEYKNNIEGLAATPDGKFLISVKDRNLEKDDGDYKAIYSFDPATQTLSPDPAIKINFDDPAFEIVRSSNPGKLIRPSDLNFNPVSGDLYVLDAEVPKILILDSSGNINSIHMLDPEEFFQPEGLCFSPSGRLFISNEGKGGDPNILEVKLN